MLATAALDQAVAEGSAAAATLFLRAASHGRRRALPPLSPCGRPSWLVLFAESWLVVLPRVCCALHALQVRAKPPGEVRAKVGARAQI